MEILLFLHTHWESIIMSVGQSNEQDMSSYYWHCHLFPDNILIHMFSALAEVLHVKVLVMSQIYGLQHQ